MSNRSASGTWTNPEAYEAFMGRWSRPAAEAALSRLTFSSDLSWLDVGCGTGASTEIILSSFEPRAVLGIDPSESFLAVANDHIRDPRVRFAIGRAESVPAPDDHYDVVLSGLVLHFVKDAAASMEEMKRVARPDGVLISYVWDIENQEQFTRAFWRAAIEADPDAAAWDRPLQQSISRRSTLLELFESSGLQEVSVQDVIFETVFQDFDDYWQPCILNGTSPVQKYGSSLSPEKQTAVRERLRANLPVSSDGTIRLKGCLLLASGIN